MASPVHLRHLALALGLGLVTGALHAQSTTAQSTPAPDPHGSVSLSVVVSPDKGGNAIGNLPQSRFTVLDNGVPQQLNGFRAVSGTSDPVKMLLVIDAVNVSFQRVAYERQEIGKLLHANDGRLSQPTALAIFTDTGTRIQPSYTTDGNALNATLDQQVIGLRDLRRSSGFYGAAERLQLSLKTLSDLLGREAAQPGRKFLVWITEGWPLLSGPNVDFSNAQQRELFREVVAFSALLERSHTTLYVVDPLGAAEGPGRTFYFEQFLTPVKDATHALPGDLGAQVLAVQSGGRFLSSSNDVSALLQQCFDDAAFRYELTYQAPPAEAPNELHRLEVKVEGDHLKAFAPHEYYANPQTPVQR